MQATVDDFTRQLDRDAVQLKQELRSVALDAIVTKDGLAGIIVGSLAGTLSFGAGAAIGLAGVWRGYRKERQKVLEKHWTSFLYGLEHQPLPVW